MPFFRKRPVVVEAVQWTGNIEEIKEFIPKDLYFFGPNVGKSINNQNWTISISTLEGDMICNIGDWIIKGVKSEFYPCKDDIFKATYEKE
jgi:hypothetical protein